MNCPLLFLWVVALSWGFAGADPSEWGACDPITPEYCGYPFPNSFYLRNASTETGWTVHLQKEMMPRHVLGPIGNHHHVEDWNARDGFSVFSPITTYLRKPDLSGVPGWANIGDYTGHKIQSILLDTTTGERVAHWVEEDERALLKEHRTLIMWPAAPLKQDRRYIVAYRNMLDIHGHAIKESEAFYDLKNGVKSSDPSIKDRQELFDNIFSHLEKQGFERSTLTQAWDFHTASAPNTFDWMLSAREQSYAMLPSAGPSYNILNVTDNYSNLTYRRVYAELTIPLFLKTKEPTPHSRLVIKDGKPVFQKWDTTTFLLLIPNSVVTGNYSDGPRPFLQYGHGLFHNEFEIEHVYLQTEAHNAGYIFACTDWWGLAEADLKNSINLMLFNQSGFRAVPDRLTQSVINHLYLTELLHSEAFANSEAMKPMGKVVVDVKAESKFLGISDGAIMGSVFMATTPKITRGALVSGGASYSQILMRSADFAPFIDLLKPDMQNGFDVFFLMPIMQQLWDRCGPGAYSPHITSDTFTKTPAKTIAFQYGLGDAQVTWLAAQSIGRAMGAKMFPNNVIERNEKIFGFEVVDGPVTSGATLQGWNFNAPLVPIGDKPPSKKTDTHQCTRRDPRSQAQAMHLLATGVIKDFCDGKGCNPLEPPRYFYRCPLAD